MTFPGTTIEVSTLQKGSSRILFDGLFAAGGVTLSQVSIMTGLEPYIIQNWVKRGFVSPPQRRQYTKEQFARIVTLNLLRDSLQLEKICSVVSRVGDDCELYHRYVDLLATGEALTTDHAALQEAATAIAAVDAPTLAAAQCFSRMLQVMAFAQRASLSRRTAEELIATIDV